MKFNKYVTVLKEKLYNSIGFPFSDVINDDIMQQALNDEKIKYRNRLYTPKSYGLGFTNALVTKIHARMLLAKSSLI